MADSSVGRIDPSVVGVSGYERAALDHYPTPRSAYDSLMEAFGDDIAIMRVWEPACGNGALSKPLQHDTLGVISTDIVRYPGFEPDAVVNFFDIRPNGEPGSEDELHLNDLAWLGYVPDCIITNPPYGKDAEAFARHALRLMQDQHGDVFLLCRHEWDCAAGRADLFDHPAFAAKITLRHRPRWIPGTKTAPRFPYAWYHWSWAKPAGARPELIYVR